VWIQSIQKLRTLPQRPREHRAIGVAEKQDELKQVSIHPALVSSPDLATPSHSFVSFVPLWLFLQVIKSSILCEKSLDTRGTYFPSSRLPV
jgi:hypothetical protein